MYYNAVKNKLFFILIKIFYATIFLIIFLEFFFQIVFLADIKSLKRPILLFNPYCDQSYWNNVKVSSFDKKTFQYHPVLTMIKKVNELAFDTTNKNHSPKKNDLIFYGSSFIDHKHFIAQYKDEVNYAVKSYGFDQIFSSYNLTKNQHPDDIIILGFLFEDLDRVLFDKRNFPKIKFIKSGNNFKVVNTPIDLDGIPENRFHFYSFNFFKNLFFLINNDYDYKRSECQINFKKDIFIFFMNEIIEHSHKLNQKLIILTFNFKDDSLENNWRYSFIKKYLSSKNITYLDTKEILTKHMNVHNLESKNYYSPKDFHLNKLGNEVIVRELNNVIEQYR